MATPTKIGPGELQIGATGAEVDWSCQITSAQVEWSADTEDDEKTLCGDVIPGARTYTAVLSGTAHQDLEATAGEGIVEFTWAQKGTTQAFVFTPSTAAGKSVTGECIIDPLTVGGEVGANGTSDFEFACVGEPELGPSPVADEQVADEQVA